MSKASYRQAVLDEVVELVSADRLKANKVKARITEEVERRVLERISELYNSLNYIKASNRSLR